MLFISMLLIFIVFVSIAIKVEYSGNPALASLPIDQSIGSMEGKEVRFGTGMSTLYSMVTTAAETGAVNNMHDTLTPITGMLAVSNMLLNTVFGGVGFMNVLMYVMIAVFMSGLMVGRTPEFLKKKIESKEMKLIAVTILIHPLLILEFTALALFLNIGNESISNPGFHGITQILYEFTSSAVNNGSGFEGLADNTLFWNITTGIVMYIGRYFSMITLLSVSYSMLNKQTVPNTVGTFRTDTALFGGILIGIIFIVGALTFFPSIALGPIAEFLTI
ncbi:potassium-transporting ATPase subunit KdpA [Gottschalkia purinilytica]|uniref:potassium-transporting ATPase subunit KdpA n=1 Tax=Gottschalkia purinilytica TaxID=1503 RepID=UPI000A8A3A02|nr:potassium-transporting ATPase subunit KdpA [Gottschalkia purinilytica]